MCKLYGYCAAKISIDLCACKSAKEHCSSHTEQKGVLLNEVRTKQRRILQCCGLGPGGIWCGAELFNWQPMVRIQSNGWAHQLSDEEELAEGIRCAKEKDAIFTSDYDIISYRIQNCFSTISTQILVNRYYFRDLWRILECKSLWITHIFAIYSDLSVVSIVMVISAAPNHQY